MRVLRRRCCVVLFACAAVVPAREPTSAEDLPSVSRVRATRSETLIGGPAGERPLALAFVDDTRLLAVTAGEVRLFRMGEADAALLSRVPLPAPRRPVRSPAALMTLDASGTVAWVLSNQDEKARLVEVDGDRLGLRAEAEAMPWPGSASGLRYRDGTDWIEGDLGSLGEGPVLAIARSDGAVAVSTAGALLREKASTARDESVPAVGPMIAPLWPGVIATSEATPPGPHDAVLVFEAGVATFQQIGEIPIDGAVRALAGRAGRTGVWLVAAIETGSGYELLRLKLERIGP